MSIAKEFLQPIIATSINSRGNSNTIGNIFTTGGNVGIGTTTPGYALDVNGNINATALTAGNVAVPGILTVSQISMPQWYITSTTPTDISYTSGIWFSRNASSTSFFNSVTSINNASATAWSSTTGTFTIPSPGVYLINLNMFCNGCSAFGRSSLSINGILGQYMPTNPTCGNAANLVSTFTYAKYFTTNDTFNFRYEPPFIGNITFYLGNSHTNLIVTKLN